VLCGGSGVGGGGWGGGGGEEGLFLYFLFQSLY